MTSKLAFVFFLTIMLTGLMSEVKGQIKVLAHITAEVVDSAHASSKIINGAELRSEQIIPVKLQQNKSLERELLNVGAVRIFAGEDIACCIDLHKTILSNNSGNFFTIEPASVHSGLSYSSNGSQTLLLNGIASVTDYPAKGSYIGHLTVVVQYN